MDLYDFIQFGHMNENDDVVKLLKNDFDVEISNDIREYNWSEQEDEFWDNTKKEAVVEEVMTKPKKNKRRINIPDAEIKHFHNRFFTDNEEYYEYTEGGQTPIEDGYNQLPTQCQRHREYVDEEIDQR